MLNTNNESSKFYEHPSNAHQNNSNLESFPNLRIPPIPKLKDPCIHYRCPNCYNFPYIEFMTNKEDITYFCNCSKDTKYLNIKDLFVPQNEKLTFLNNSNEKQKEGFKCKYHKSDISGKNKKFKYFCASCNINIGNDCLLYHLHKNHDAINLEFQKLEMNEKINLINEKLNEIKGKNEEIENIKFDEEISIDNNYDNNNQTIKFEKLDNGNYKKISSENKNAILDNFI